MTKKKSLPPLDKSVLKTLASDDRQIYSPYRHPIIIERLVGAGLNDSQIAGFLGIAPETFTGWKNKYQVVRRIVDTARMERDVKVFDALYKRAIGYENPEEDIRVVDKALVITPILKHYPGDVRAQELWLFNRMPQDWKSKTNIELTGKDGGPMEHVNLTPEQAAEALASLGLRRAASQLDGKEISDDDTADE